MAVADFGSARVNRLERLDEHDFEEGRLRRPGRWVVAFLAEWCPYCREFAEPFATLAESGAHLAVADLTRLESPLWDELSVEVVPSVIVFQDGEVVDRVDGRLMEGLDGADLERVRTAASSG